MSSFTINKNASTLMFSTEHDSPRFRENNLGQKLTQCQCGATSKIKHDYHYLMMMILAFKLWSRIFLGKTT
jgi:hypothetical protein